MFISMSVFFILVLIVFFFVTYKFFMPPPSVFDKKIGWYWKGKIIDDDIEQIKQQHDAIELSKIHAIQLLSEYVESKLGPTRSSTRQNPFYSYELNLVLKDGSRINVIEDINQRRLEKDASDLSDFLNVPVWSVI